MIDVTDPERTEQDTGVLGVATDGPSAQATADAQLAEYQRQVQQQASGDAPAGQGPMFDPGARVSAGYADTESPLANDPSVTGSPVTEVAPRADGPASPGGDDTGGREAARADDTTDASDGGTSGTESAQTTATAAFDSRTSTDVDALSSDQVTKDDLVAMATNEGVPVYGTKRDIAARLVAKRQQADA